MLPIPISMLIHSATLCDVVTDEYGNPTDTQAALLERVCFAPRTKLVRTKDNTEIQSTLTLVLDARNSRPHGVNPRVGQAVWWEGERFVIADVRRMYARSRLNHWEVALIGG